MSIEVKKIWRNIKNYVKSATMSLHQRFSNYISSTAIHTKESSKPTEALFQIWTYTIFSNHLNYHISIKDFKEAEASKARWEKYKAQKADWWKFAKARPANTHKVNSLKLLNDF